MVSVNNSTSGAEAHLPFGGNGKSGNGSRQSGIWVLDQFTRWQSMNWDYAGKLQKAQMDVADVSADLDFRLPGGSFHDPARPHDAISALLGVLGSRLATSKLLTCVLDQLRSDAPPTTRGRAMNHLRLAHQPLEAREVPGTVMSRRAVSIRPRSRSS